MSSSDMSISPQSTNDMRSALGFLIILWGLSTFFSVAFSQLETTAVSTLHTIETAATVSREMMLENR
jgi:hypothetical protein